MSELLEHLERAQPLIANLDRNFAQTIQTLTQQGADAERRTQPAFRHQVAYAVQDLEKSAVWPIAMAPELRS
jgi:butyrate kinase